MDIYYVMVVDLQPRGREDFSTPDSWILKRKAQEFCGALSALDRGHPKCIDLQHVSDSLVPLSIYCSFTRLTTGM